MAKNLQTILKLPESNPLKKQNNEADFETQSYSLAVDS